MTKFFYTDPLAAAWMADKFGMKFSSHIKSLSNPQWDNASMFVNRNGNWVNDHFYIHLDSLHLLEPQVGDIQEVTDIELGNFIHRMLTIHDFLPNAKIIQRNDIPFMWPEVEGE